MVSEKDLVGNPGNHWENSLMTESDKAAPTLADLEEVQADWSHLKTRISQLEMERCALEQELKTLRALVERVVEHRQQSHSELVLLLTNLVSKLPQHNLSILVAQLMEHNTQVSEMCAALIKGRTGATLPQPSVLKALEETKRELAAAIPSAVEAVLSLNPPLEAGQLRTLSADPEQFFAPAIVRAHRCFLKGQVPRERVVREFGEAALPLFQDLTTDPKLNPRPKPEEIVLAFHPDFEALLPRQPGLTPEQRAALQQLFQQVQDSKADTEAARAQRLAFHKLSFLLELLHYYEHQNTEAPDVVFAQRLPALIEQLVLIPGRDDLNEALLVEAEALLARVLAPDHRLMIINNIGKSGGVGRTLKFVLRLRTDQVPDQSELIPEFIKHLIPARRPPAPGLIPAVLKRIHPEQRLCVLRAIQSTDRISREQADNLARAAARELGLSLPEIAAPAGPAVSPETERKLAWEEIKGLINRRAKAASVAAAIRDRLHAQYDADELRESWLVLAEADAMALIRIFCQLPYLADGRTDPLAQTIMTTYISRLMHEKYANVYQKIVNSLRNMIKANPQSPTLVNFMTLVRWVDAEAARRLNGDLAASGTA